MIKNISSSMMMEIMNAQLPKNFGKMAKRGVVKAVIVVQKPKTSIAHVAVTTKHRHKNIH